MEWEENAFKTPLRNSIKSELITPANPTFQTTPLSYRKLTISSFLKRDHSFRGCNADSSSRLYSNLSCDRFIPNRRLFDSEMSNLLHTSQRKSLFTNTENKPLTEARVNTPQNNTSPPQFEQFAKCKEHYAWSERPANRKKYKSRVVSLMMNGRSTQPRVLNLTTPHKKAEEVTTTIACNPSTPIKRHIPKFPDKILDMPHICKEFGSNIMHWDEGSDMMVVGLKTNVFAWHPVTKFCMKIPVNNNKDYSSSYTADSNITAVALSHSGQFVSMSMKSGKLRIWDRTNFILTKLENEMGCHKKGCTGICYTTSFLWLPSLSPLSIHYLFAGTKCGYVHKIIIKDKKDFESEDIYQASNAISKLAFSTDYINLAILTLSGRLTVMEVKEKTMIMDKEVHKGLSKGMAWCPWKQHYIATASLGDHKLRVWNVKKNTMVLEKHFTVPVICVTWFEGQKELITGHCSEESDKDHDNYLQIWKFPSMEVVCRLVGHEASVIYIAVGLNNTLLASVGADETLLMWRCFDTFKFKNNQWVEEKKVKKEKCGLSPTKRLLETSVHLNSLNIR